MATAYAKKLELTRRPPAPLDPVAEYRAALLDSFRHRRPMPTWVYLTQGPAERKAYNDELVAWHDGKQRLENAKQALKGHRPLAWDDAHP